MGEKRTVLNLRVDIDLWNKFKERVNRNTKLNDAVVLLIQNHVNQDKFDIGEVK